MLAVLAMTGGLHAQDAVRTDTVGTKFYFRRGYSMPDLSYRGNGERLDAFVRHLQTVQQDTLKRIARIRIVAAASPEGSNDANLRLAERRANNIDKMLRRRLTEYKGYYNVQSKGIDWPGLLKLVKQHNGVPHRDEVLQILQQAQQEQDANGLLQRLSSLHGGESWRWMDEHLFPELRSSGVELQCEIEVLSPEVPESDWIEPAEPVQTEEAVAETVPQSQPEVSPQPEQPIQPSGEDNEKRLKPFYMAVKTNLLYDAALVPNLGVEFYLKKGWSIGASWMYAWWKTDRKPWYWRTYGGELEVRKYLGRKAQEKPLQGHHLGLYGQMLTYDFEWGGRGYLADKWSYGVGLEYGYSLPLTRRLNMDFGIGLGYLGGTTKEYLPQDGHYVWQITKKRHWFGPTKLEVSLVWLIGRGNYNKGKGGAK